MIAITRDTLFGRTIILDNEMETEGIVMHPDTWRRIKPIAYRNAVPVEITNATIEQVDKITRSLSNVGEESKSSS